LRQTFSCSRRSNLHCEQPARVASAPALIRLDQQLTTLLKEHISIAVDLIKAAKAGDKANQQQADTKWRLTKKWDDDVRAFDAVYDHILHMSDALADGIVKQFPDKFGGAASPTTAR